MRKAVCINCSVEFETKYRNKFCNRKCYFASDQYKVHVKKNGDNNKKPIYGRIMNNGYWYIYRPYHPEAKKTAPKGYIYEHRYVMESYLNRYLSHDEIVHHKNGVKTDNRIENLILTNRREHMNKHAIVRNERGQFIDFGTL